MKILTEEDVKWKGKEYYHGLKERFNKPEINDWYEKIYRHPQSIGYVSNFFKKHRPTSYENAYDLYTLSGILDKDEPKIYRGRTKEEIEELAIEWKEKSGSSYPLSEFYDAIVLHAVVETVYGNEMEGVAKDKYRKLGYQVEEPICEDDRKMGVDFIAKKDGKTVTVQIKPSSFFMGRKADLVKDRVEFFDKIKRAVKKYHPDIFSVMIYDKERNKKWLTDGGRFNFRYEDLVTIDGSVIADINKMTKQGLEL